MEEHEKNKDNQIPFVTLDKVIIQGFRSIEHIELAIPKGEPVILTGKNECGKSNILKAIELLSTQEFAIDDEKQGDEEIDNCVKFVCNVDWKHIFFENIIYKNIDFDSLEFEQEKLVLMKKEILSDIITILENTKTQCTVTIAPENSLHIDNNIPQFEINKELPDYELYTNYGSTTISRITLGSVSYPSDYTRTHVQYVAQEIAKKILPNYLEEFLPNIILWDYNKINTSHKINIEQFIQDPYSHSLLQSLFLITGTPKDKIPEKIQKWLKVKHKNQKFMTELDKINKKLTEIIKQRWKEYGLVKIHLDTKDFLTLYISIKEESYFNFDERSEGFKRFMILLLTAIAPIEQENTNRQTVLLIDEPETSLHPSAAKDLHNTLKELAKKTPIIYATHSISMLDTITISNNILVTKENENTSIKKAEEGDIYPAMHIYESIGYSLLDDVLKSQYIFFEGFYDKILFDTVMQDDYSYWKNIGIRFMRGVDNIKYFVPFFDSFDSIKYIIVSDSDKKARSVKTLFEQSHKDSKNKWYTYTDLELGTDKKTGEDFLKDTYIQEQLQITDELLQYNKIETIYKQLENIKSKFPNIETIKDCKSQLWNNVTKDDILIDEVQKVLDKIKEKLEAQILTV